MTGRSTPATVLERTAATSPNAPALAFDGGTCSFRDLDLRAAVAADRWAESGHGDIVTVCMEPGPELVVALFALWKLGHVVVPLHAGLSDREALRAHQLLRPTHVVDPGGVLTPSDSGSGRDKAGRDDLVAYVLTSGSSGASRAVGFTDGAFRASTKAVSERLDLTARDCWGLCLSPAHIGGLALVLRAVGVGSSIYLWPRFDEAAVATAILEERISHLSVVPVMLARLVDALAGRAVPPTLRCVLTGGAATPPTLLQRSVDGGLPVATTWGMTETTSQVASAPPELVRRWPGTAGPPLPGIEVRVGRDARLEVRGRTLASVVWAEPGGDPEPLPTDADGWFTTADAGRIDGEGRVWVGGRVDGTIISGGLNVVPEEIEQVIEEIPGVTGAVVFGVPDEDWGQIVAAAVEAPEGGPTAEDIDVHCRGRLTRGRCPSHIVVVAALPRTPTGKVSRAGLTARYGPGA